MPLSYTQSVPHLDKLPRGNYTHFTIRTFVLCTTRRHQNQCKHTHHHQPTTSHQLSVVSCHLSHVTTPPQPAPALIVTLSQPITNQRPMTSDQLPATSYQQPMTSDQQPATNDQRPATSSSRCVSVRHKKLTSISARSNISAQCEKKPDFSALYAARKSGF